jgi:hypothetical protein
MMAQWAHPPLAITVARGLRVVAGSPVLMISSFLAVLGLWLGFAAFGLVLAAQPGLMGMLLSLPPVHNLVLDLQVLFTSGASSPLAGTILVAGLLVVRAALTGFWTALVLERLAAGNGPDPAGLEAAGGGGWRAEVARALRRMVRCFGPLIGVEAGFFTLAIATYILAAGFLGQLGVLVGLIGGLYFLVFAPVVAVAEGVGLRSAFTFSFRAARLPGPRHMVATTSYMALTLLSSLFAPVSRVAAATPSLAVWLFVLFVTFLHMTALATFAHRWLIVRERTLESMAGSSSGKNDRPAPATLR